MNDAFPPGDPGVAYLVDLSTWVHRSFHATPLFRSPDGKPANAVKGIAQMFARLFRDRSPRLLAAALDSKGVTIRHELFPGYKAERKPHAPELIEQFEPIRELLTLHGVAQLEQQGYEADDILATATRFLRDEGLRVVIIALDKDLHQLVEGDDVVVWDFRDRWTNETEVTRRWGVGPKQLVDMMALMGDPTDGIPGIEGVGKKTAANLIQKRGTLDEVLRKAAWESRPALRTKLSQAAESARISKELVRLRDDVPIEITVEALRPHWDDAEPIRAFFRRYGFNDLADQVRTS